MVWIQEQLAKYGHNVVLESVRRWFNGTVRPRFPIQKALAEILSVDLAWLSTGKSDVPSVVERRKIVLSESGAVGALAAVLNLAGFAVAEYLSLWFM